MHLDHCLVLARARDLALQRNLAAVDVDAVLLGERVGDILARDRAEELAAFADAHGDLDADLFELRGQKARLVGRLLLLPCGGIRLLLRRLKVRCRRFDGELLGQQEVPAVAFRNLDDVTLASDLLDVLLQYHFHLYHSPLYVSH